MSVPIDAASSTTARTSFGRVAESARATQLPKAWPATMAGVESPAPPVPSTAAATSAARS
ncbi:hypothetical protein [Dankookia sp. P2]|uniref:hypothetical protein n=1 Tax=Dankookia sp. P2 TaxID=3423955 RepID=UPI003D668908